MLFRSHTFHNISGYLHPATESPLTYFVNNMFLHLGQRNIAGMGENLPYYILHGARDWNGSAWTLIYEFKAYIMAQNEQIDFTAEEWNSYDDVKKQQILMNYRIAYLGETMDRFGVLMQLPTLSMVTTVSHRHSSYAWRTRTGVTQIH